MALSAETGVSGTLSATSFFRGGGYAALLPTKLTRANVHLSGSSRFRPPTRAMAEAEDCQQLLQRRRQLLAAAPLLAASAAAGPSLGVPVTPPDLAKCQPAVVNVSGQPTLNVSCCLPESAAAPVVYVPKVKGPLRVRKRANALDKSFVAKYDEAYRRMRALPDSDPRSFKQQADVHCAFCNGAYPSPQNSSTELQIHFSYLFFPWHRWYLYFHERILGSLINDPTFAIPYWNWDDQEYGGNVMPEIFTLQNTYPSLYDVNRNQNHLPPSLATLSLSSSSNTTDEQIIANNISVMFNSLIKPNTQTLFLGDAPTFTSLNDTTAQGSLEAGPHTAIHVFAGNPNNPYREDMGNFYSAGRDPLFYCHHSNVDRCWYIWDTIPGKRKELYSDADFLNSSFLFYDENAKLVQVYVKDSLDTKAQLGITYEPSPGSDLYRAFAPQPLGRIKGKVPKNKGSLPKFVSKSAGQAVKEISPSQTLSAVVARPTGKAAFAASKGIQESEVEEVLVLESVTVPKTTSTYIAVYINLPEATDDTPLDVAEYVGSYANVPHIGMDMPVTTDVKLSIGSNITSLGIEDQDSLAVTVVAKLLDSSSTISISGFKIVYV